MGDRWFEWRTTLGEPITAGETRITPQSRALVVRLPFGGLVWNRPTGVLVERPGQSEKIPVVDVTGTAVLALTALGVIIPLFLKLLRGGK